MPRNATAQNIVIHEPAAKPIGPSYQLLPNKFFYSIIPPQSLKNPKWSPGGPKMAGGV